MCGKCENWVTGVLGLWVLLMPFLMPFLGIAADLQRILTVITGLVLAVFGFWGVFKKSKAAA